MNILFIGDVVGVAGRRVLAAHLPELRTTLQLDFVIANCENATDAGIGVTPQATGGLFDLGVDVLTTGNHVWDNPQAQDYVAREPRLLRPHNYPAGTPGSGWYVAQVGRHRVGVLNVLGTMFMQPALDCPFQAADRALTQKPEDVRVVLVDVHAEAAAEKYALGWHLAGRVSAVIGSHTHVPTADERMLPGGTAYITDVGMTGCYDSVVGLGIDNAIKRLMYKMPAPWDPADGPGTLCGVVVDVDEDTGRGRAIRRIALAEN